MRAGQEANQAMIVGALERTSTLENVLSQCGRFGLLPNEAAAIIDEVEATVAQHWREEFVACGVPEPQIAQLDGRAVMSPVARLRKVDGA
jgi:hypothetical protein